MTTEVRPLIAVTSPSRRRWYHYSMRSLLVFTTLVACFLGWVATERRQSEFERQLGKRLLTLECDIQFLGQFDSPELQQQNQPQGSWRDLTRHILGKRISTISFESYQHLSDWRSFLVEWEFPNFEFASVSNLTLLSGLENLITLRLNGTSFKEVIGLTELATLQHLELTGTCVSDLTPLAGLTSLRTLRLSSTSINDLPPLARLKNLHTLQLQLTSFHDLTPLANLANLKELYIKSSLVSDLTPIAGLTRLESLHVASNSLNDLAPLTGLENLERLQLIDISASDFVPLSGLKKLECLILSSTLLGDLTPLAGLKNLKMLHVSGKSLLDKDIEFLRQALPNCRINR